MDVNTILPGVNPPDDARTEIMAAIERFKQAATD